MPLPDGPALALTRRYQANLAQLADRRLAVVQRAWTDTGFDEPDVEVFAQRIAPTMVLLTTAALRQSTAFYSVLTRTRPPSIKATDLVLADESRDPFIAYWRALKMGRPVEEAVASGAARAEAITRNRVQSAARRTGDLFVERTGIKVRGWRRVPNSGACNWCNSQAGKTFGSSEATDYGHDACGCTSTMVLA